MESTFLLASGQESRPFSVVNRSCTPIEFVAYETSMDNPSNGMISLSIAVNFNYEISFNISECPIGFQVTRINELQVVACISVPSFSIHLLRGITLIVIQNLVYLHVHSP